MSRSRCDLGAARQVLIGVRARSIALPASTFERACGMACALGSRASMRCARQRPRRRASTGSHDCDCDMLVAAVRKMVHAAWAAAERRPAVGVRRLRPSWRERDV